MLFAGLAQTGAPIFGLISMRRLDKRLNSHLMNVYEIVGLHPSLEQHETPKNWKSLVTRHYSAAKV